MVQRYALLLLLSFCSIYVSAEHLPGGSISARCVGNNFYEVTLKLYRECSGVAMIPQKLHFENDCGVTFDQPNLLPVSVEDVSPLCAEDLPNSICNGGTLIGFELYTYQTTVFMSPCNAWRVSWSICCRNVSLNVQGTPGLWLETSFNNFGSFCNAGAEFVDNKVPLVCVGQPVSYDASATDADGHTLRYRFVNAQFNLGQPEAPDPMSVLYFPPLSGSQPYTGMEIVFNDANGVAQVTAARALLVCTEGDFCATLEFDDVDIDQTLAIVSNISTALPGAEINLSGTNPVTAEVCWNSTGVAAGTYQFSITVTDDACPVQGFQQFAYTVNISTGGASAGQDSLVEYCAAQSAFDLFPLLGGTPSEGGSWTDPNTMDFGGTFDPGSDPPGEYTYDVGSINECSGTAVLSLVLLADTAPACLTIGMEYHAFGELQVLPEGNMSGRYRIIAPRNGAYLLSVISNDGRVAYEGRVQLTGNSPFPLDLGQLTGGTYVLRLINKDDGSVYTKRVMVR